MVRKIGSLEEIRSKAIDNLNESNHVRISEARDFNETLVKLKKNVGKYDKMSAGLAGDMKEMKESLRVLKSEVKTQNSKPSQAPVHVRAGDPRVDSRDNRADSRPTPVFMGEREAEEASKKNLIIGGLEESDERQTLADTHKLIREIFGVEKLNFFHNAVRVGPRLRGGSRLVLATFYAAEEVQQMMSLGRCWSVSHPHITIRRDRPHHIRVARRRHRVNPPPAPRRRNTEAGGRGSGFNRDDHEHFLADKAAAAVARTGAEPRPVARNAALIRLQHEMGRAQDEHKRQMDAMQI